MREVLSFLSLQIFDMQGYGFLLLKGTWMTLKLSILSLSFAFLLGLCGAGARLSSIIPLRFIGTTYTTLVRGIPDLVLMLIVFYGVQTIVANLGDAIGWGYIELDPFASGVVAIGFIYGAYFAETFRGAFLAIPRGQWEAGAAYGMRPWQVFIVILFPQMMRHALPGIGNNWLVLLKATALVSIIGLADLVDAAQSAGKSTYRLFYFLVCAAVIYLAIASLSNLILRYLERRYSLGQRRGRV